MPKLPPGLGKGAAIIGGAIIAWELGRKFFPAQPAAPLRIDGPPGWPVLCIRSPFGDNFWAGASSFWKASLTGTGCGTEGAPAGQTPVAFPPGGGSINPFEGGSTVPLSIHIGEDWQVPPAIPQKRTFRSFNRPAGNTRGSPVSWKPSSPARKPIPIPDPPPNMPDPGVDPFDVPVWGKPGPDSPANPNPEPDPGSEPTVWEIPSIPGRPPINIPAYILPPLPTPGVPPSAPPSTVPSYGYEWPSLGSRPVPKVGHQMRPPRGREREKKMRLPALAAIFKQFINAVTETADFVDAMYYAIHGAARIEGGATGFMNPADRASFVWSNLDLVNWRQFIKNLINNGAEDFFYGSLGAGTKWFNQQSGNMGFKDAALQHGSSAGTSKTDFGNRNPVLDAIAEAVEAAIGTDPEWTAANLSRKTAARTFGLPQQTQLRPQQRQYEAPRVKAWERWSKRK